MGEFRIETAEATQYGPSERHVETGDLQEWVDAFERAGFLQGQEVALTFG